MNATVLRNRKWATALTTAAALVLAVAFASPAAAAVPGTMVLDGVMASSGGGAAADGVYKVTFSIYNVQSGGSAAWTEGPINVEVKGGRFSYDLGTTKAVPPAIFASLTKAWLGIQIGTEPELPRRQMHAVAYAMQAAQAEKLACSGCVGAEELAKGAVSAEKVGFSYAGSKTKGGPADVALTLQCTGCVTVDMLKFDKDLDLGGNALKAGKVNAKDIVATTVQAGGYLGDGSKLTGIKIPSGECKVAGEVVKGINPDGSLKCVKSMDPNGLPADGLNEISNNLIHNQFVDQTCGAVNIPIPDNNPVGVADTLTFPDIGLAQSLDIDVEVTNSDIGKVTLRLYDPNNKEYVLYAENGKGTLIKTSFPSLSPLVKGDLKEWVNKNPKGKWRLVTVDNAFLNNKTDGVVKKWCVRIQTLSNKKVQVKGDLIVDGNITSPGGLKVDGSIKIGADSGTCDAGKKGTLRYDATYGLEVCNGAYWHAAKAKPIIYRGYCSKHGLGPGWIKYCLNATHFNTAEKYLKVTGDEVQFLIPGYYRIDFWTISVTNSYPHIQMFRKDVKGTNAQIYFSHEYVGAQWDDNQAQVVYPFAANERFWLQIHDHDGGNNYAYHHGNPTNSYGGLTVTFMGPLTP